MASGLTSPAGDELERLRQQYDRLCDLMTRTAESDPVAAERVLTELQALSERILLLQALPEDSRPPAPAADAPTPAPAEATATPPPAALPEPPAKALAPAAPTAPSAAAPPAEPPLAPPQAGPEAAPARIVAFRVTPTVGQRPAASEPAAASASWRLDAPPPDLGRQDAPAGTPSPAPSPQAAPAPPQRVAAAATPPMRSASITVRKTAAARPASAAAPPRPARPTNAPPSEPAEAPAAAATAPPRQPAPPAMTGAASPQADAVPEPSTARLQPEATTSGNATVFSSAIRHWLERHRNAPAEAAAAPDQAPKRAKEGEAPMAKPTRTSPDPAPRTAEAGAAREPQTAQHVAAAIEQQALQIERILQLCEAHQLALEQLEERIEARIDARLEARLAAAPAATDPELPALRAAVEEQRQRITALAKTIHNLAQWLATQRGS